MLTEMSKHVTRLVAEQASEHPSDQPMEDASGSGEVSDHDDPQEAQSSQPSPSINQSEPRDSYCAIEIVNHQTAQPLSHIQADVVVHQANVADSQPVNEPTSQPT